VNFREKVLPTLTLFSSVSTLLCCALPALMVSIGAGVAMAGLVGAVPQLVWLSEHKATLFVGAGILIVLSAFSIYRNRDAPCPADSAQMRSCLRLRRWVKLALYLSVVIYSVGFFFAFIAGRLANI
jgi:predicted membrane channel-forming protein YqfA (hemolysin III family)